MPLDVGSIVLSGAVAAGSSVLTIWLTPKLGHRFWKLQRKQEIRLDSIGALVALTSEFFQQWISENTKRFDRVREAKAANADPQTLAVATRLTWNPSIDWYIRQHVVDSQLKALFTEPTYALYKQLEKRFNPELGGPEGRPDQSGFEKAYAAAYEHLYAEVFGEPKR